MTATAFAPLVGIPTTTAALELWNNTNSGMTMAIDELTAFSLLGTAATQVYGLWAQVAAAKAVPIVTGLVIGSASGRAPYTSTAGARVVTGVGTAVVANSWQPWGAPMNFGTAAATPGPSWSAAINGKLIVPPGSSLCIHVVGSLATASSFHCGAKWYEVPSLTNVA